MQSNIIKGHVLKRGMNMNFDSIIAYIACIFFLFIFGRIFIVPIKTILKLVLNSILGRNSNIYS